MIPIDKAAENEEFVLGHIIRNYVTKIANEPVNKTRLCCDCGEEIEEKRLVVLPQAQRCIECATDFDKKTKFEKSLNSTRGIIRNMET